MIVDNKLLAWTGAAGTLCDAVGGVYLTYDLLGGARGPLGFLNRALTYSLLFGFGYGVVFGLWIGIITGIGLGALLAFDYWSLARHQRLYGSSPLSTPPTTGALRGIVLGLATWHSYGRDFALLFGASAAAGLFAIYEFGHGTSSAVLSDPRFRVRPQAIKSAALRGLAIGLAGAVAGVLSTGNPFAVGFGLVVGSTVGLISAAISMLSPVIESRLENLPDKHLAVFGFILILMGLILQSFQYVAVLTDMPMAN